MELEEIKKLIIKYNHGNASEQERAIVIEWYESIEGNDPEFANGEFDGLRIKVQQILNEYRGISKPKINPVSIWLGLAKAAAIVAVISTGMYFFNKSTGLNDSRSTVYKNDVTPGGVGATLTLADGKQIVLSDAITGELAKEAGLSISKSADGQLVYEIKDKASADKNKINTLSTAKGETYQVLLPDGSLVALNAASSLTYATSLNERGERRVKLRGEAYFEVAKDKSHPFIVESYGQEIAVLGTHFNVNAYGDESLVKTTLIEGRVRVSDQMVSKILLPGQQAILESKGNIEIKPADELLDLAWKNNKFMFESASIENVMKMVERWYNVEVVYKGKKTAEKFTGTVSRFDKVSKVLKVLERTGTVCFEIEGRKIYVKNNEKY